MTPCLKDFLINQVGMDVGSWVTERIEPADWLEFGPVDNTTAEFKATYDAFAPSA